MCFCSSDAPDLPNSGERKIAPIMKNQRAKVTQKTQPDHLYVIFEQHLFNFQEPGLDRKTFVCNVLNDYFSHLRRHSIVIPKSLEPMIFEELFDQVHTMLVKKIYGCFNIPEFQKRLPVDAKRKAQTKYSKLK
jgi:hypothetical protein